MFIYKKNTKKTVTIPKIRVALIVAQKGCTKIKTSEMRFYECENMCGRSRACNLKKEEIKRLVKYFLLE